MTVSSNQYAENLITIVMFRAGSLSLSQAAYFHVK